MGQIFLLKCASEWPNQISVPSISKNDTEIKKEIIINITTIDLINDLMTYFSAWNALQRAVAWLRRFKTYCKNRFLRYEEEVSKGSLTVNELPESTKIIMNPIQQEAFQCEIDDLLHGKSVKKESRLASLNPVLHDDLLRFNGRLDLPLEKCPIILPNCHHGMGIQECRRYYHHYAICSGS